MGWLHEVPKQRVRQLSIERLHEVAQEPRRGGLIQFQRVVAPME